MKKVLLGALVACAVIAPAATAQAATTTSHCDTDNVTSYVTKEGKRKIKVKTDARGCIEHTTDDSGAVTCSRVTMMLVQSSVKFLDKRVKTERRWGNGATFTNPWNGCSDSTGPDPLFEKTEEWGGRYRYKPNWCAFPIVKVIVHGQQEGSGSEIDPETIVTIRKARGWKFTRGMNSGSCKFDWDGNGRDRGNGITELPAAPALPSAGAGDSDPNWGQGRPATPGSPLPEGGGGITEIG